VSSHNLSELIRLRAEFECLAVSEAIILGDLQWECNVHAALYQLRQINRMEYDSDKQENWENAHRHFHLQLMAACNMPLLLQFCSMLNDLVDRYRRIFLAGHPSDPETNREHGIIGEAAVARDAQTALATLRRHIERTGIRIMSGLQEMTASE